MYEVIEMDCLIIINFLYPQYKGNDFQLLSKNTFVEQDDLVLKLHDIEKIKYLQETVMKK